MGEVIHSHDVPLNGIESVYWPERKCKETIFVPHSSALIQTIFFIFVKSTYTIIMEKLRNLRKQRGFTQEYMSNVLSTDISNYSRKESGNVKIYDDEWEKLAKALDVPVDDIKEERPNGIVQNNDNLVFNDNSSYHQSGIYNCTIPNYILESQQEYIKLLKEQIELLKEENSKNKSEK